YTGIVRYTSTQDVFRIILVIFSGSILFIITNLITYYFINERFFIPFSIIIIEFIATSGALSLFRMIVKLAYLELINPPGEQTRVIIFGAGEAGVITKNALERDSRISYKVQAFIDDNEQKVGKTLEGVTIYPPDKLVNLIAEGKTDIVIIATARLKPERKQEIIELCLKYNARVLHVPPVSQWINGELSFRQIKKVRIEDLLEREIIRLDEDNISRQLAGMNVLITGAGGSIGSEIARQVSGYSVNKLILVDQAESPLFHLDLECQDRCAGKNFEILVADICDHDRMDYIFRQHKPDVVFHAAAYKHVPMMEYHPGEAVKTNVMGTRLLADLSIEYGVRRFIMVSTDKAVNPTNVMGASKRIAEIYTQALNGIGNTLFITTRFGNVLGSNGSVIPLFRDQIEKGGPVTVTHPEITRFFMTIPEACQLVLEAGAMGKGGEVYIFDMGKSVKIVDLAKKMIQLSGLEVGKDIHIKFTGLRPGEKLYEELLNDSENTIPTHHPQIMIAKVMTYSSEQVQEGMDKLDQVLRNQNDLEIVTIMKEIVPEFKSQNSVYQKLDFKE
ncbi:MAG: polysaccharide biosynthesis protein, partial [Bacteroidetes bacterium]|nr:polysaccharide biosynthesis protein [Bacteroidota bacterium]